MHHGIFKLSEMNILVTGGLGYLGGCLVQKLNENKTLKVLIGSRRKSIASFSTCTPVVEMTWSSESQLRTVCSGIDVVIHLAAMDADQSLADPVGALEVNGVCTARLLEAAIKEGVSRFIYLSTSHVYGNSFAGIITEKTLPEPIHPYATSHRAGEDVVFAANYFKKIKGIILRLSNSVGKPADMNTNCWKLLVPDLCKQAIEHEKLVLKSNGLQKRNFIPITETCRAIEHFVTMAQEKNIPPIINIGSRENISVLEMAYLIQSRYEVLFGSVRKIERVSPKVGEEGKFYKYSIDLLEQTGFYHCQRLSSVIDELLIYSNENYVSKPK